MTMWQVDTHRIDLPDTCFHVITMNSMIDPLSDLAAPLAKVRGTSRPSGVLALSMPRPLPYAECWRWHVDLFQELSPSDVREDSADLPTWI